MDSVNIAAQTRRKFDISSIVSVKASVKGSTTIAAKEGHLVFLDPATNVWTAYALSANLTTYMSGTVADSKVSAPVVGVLGEDSSLTTTAGVHKVIIKGNVYIDYVRDAGITASVLPDGYLIGPAAAQSAGITFLNYEAKEV